MFLAFGKNRAYRKEMKEADGSSKVFTFYRRHTSQQRCSFVYLMQGVSYSDITMLFRFRSGTSTLPSI